MKRVICSTIVSFLCLSVGEAVTILVSDTRPGELGVTQPTTNFGSVVSTGAVPTATYTISGLNLTSVGGGVSETIAFDINYSQNGGTAVQINGFGNISVTGGADDNQIDVSPVDNEDLTATLSLNAGLTTFSGGLSLSLVESRIGGYNSWEQYNLITSAGTSLITNGDPQAIDSSFFTIDPIDVGGFSNTDQLNISGFTVEIVAVPEPSGCALISLAGLILVMRRRR